MYDLEKNLSELEKIVETLENGKCSLDEALELFEKGVTISKECSKELNTAKQKVKTLTESLDGEND